MRRALVLLLLAALAIVGCGRSDEPKKVRLPPHRLPPPPERHR